MTDDRVPGEPVPGVDLTKLQKAIEDLQLKVSLWEEQRLDSAPTPSSQLGLSAFIIMPFGPADLQWVYDHNVRPAVENCGLRCVRGDDMFGSDVVMEDVLAGIGHACIVIADLTGQNANVFYEVGIAHAQGKPVLLLAQSLDDVPFDLRHRRILIYEYSPPGIHALDEKLESHITSMVKAAKANGS